MFCFVILCIIMAGFEFDDEDFSLSGLTQEGHDSVTVINSSSSSDDENYHGLMECAHQLARETSNKVSMEHAARCQAARCRARSEFPDF